jgi:hypothetical protein
MRLRYGLLFPLRMWGEFLARNKADLATSSPIYPPLQTQYLEYL